VDVEAARRAAGEAAVPLVEDGMRVGLGTGTTAHWFILGLGQRVRAGLSIRAVATSTASAELAAAHGIRVEELGADGLDIAVDGADSVDPALRLIKGRGGAMVREKIVATAAARFVVIVDDSKVAGRLHGRVPVEIVTFGSARTVRVLRDRTSIDFSLRTGDDGRLVRTDNGNLIADSDEAVVEDPAGLAAVIETIPGCAGHGLFIGMTDLVLVGHADGSVERRSATAPWSGDTVDAGG
jgi:ribose 5-phosphate isomerase A